MHLKKPSMDGCKVKTKNRQPLNLQPFTKMCLRNASFLYLSMLDEHVWKHELLNSIALLKETPQPHLL